MSWLRYRITWWWQILGGAAFAVLVAGASDALASPALAAGRLTSVYLLAVVVAAGTAGIYAGLSATVVLVACRVALTLPLPADEAVWLTLDAVVMLLGAILVGALRQDLAHDNDELDATRVLLTAANSRLERAKEMDAARAYYDPITDLPTRRLVVDRFSQIVAQARRSHTHAAVTLINLNRFSEVNDGFGRDVGDEALRQFGQRLTATMRRGDTVGRIEGNTFVVVLGGVAQRAGADIAAMKLLETTSDPVEINGRSIRLTASIGLAVYPDDGEDWDTLYRSAEEALQRARRRR